MDNLNILLNFKTIGPPKVSDDKTSIYFLGTFPNKEYKYNEGDVISLDTHNDCCNRVWFNHLSGLEALSWATIEEIYFDDWKEPDEYEGGDHAEEVCFIRIKTNKGWATLDIRNSHNGYYGGHVSCNSDLTLFQFMRFVLPHSQIFQPKEDW